MNVLVIVGSPKREGQTSQVLNAYLAPYKSAGDHIEFLFLRSLKISPCTACDLCQETGVCAIPDDMQMVYQKIKEANLVVMATPIYFNSVSAWMKIMIDRCQVYWSKKFVLNDRKGIKDKAGVFICTAGVKHDKSSLIGATKVLDLFFKAIDAEYLETICIDDTDKTPVHSQVDKLKQVEAEALKHIAGMNLVQPPR